MLFARDWYDVVGTHRVQSILNSRALNVLVHKLWVYGQASRPSRRAWNRCYCRTAGVLQYVYLVMDLLLSLLMVLVLCQVCRDT